MDKLTTKPFYWCKSCKQWIALKDYLVKKYICKKCYEKTKNYGYKKS